MKHYILITISSLLFCNPIAADSKTGIGMQTKIKDHTLEELLLELLKDPANEHLDMLVIEASYESWHTIDTLKNVAQYQRYKYATLLYHARNNNLMYCENHNAIIFTDSTIPLECSDCAKMLLQHQYEKLASAIDSKFYGLSRKQTRINQQVAENEQYIRNIRQQTEQLLLKKEELEGKKQELQKEKKALYNDHIIVTER